MDEPVEVTIRLTATVEKSSVIRNGRSRPVYTARIGAVEASAGTKAEATLKLAEAVRAGAENYGIPVVLWSLDGREAWIAFPDQAGNWGYAITDAARPGCDPRFGGTKLWQTTGGWALREDCLDRMRSHWWDQNGRCIVEGILALCTDMRRFECGRCRSVSVSGAPYKCRNPACGEEYQAAA